MPLASIPDSEVSVGPFTQPTTSITVLMSVIVTTLNEEAAIERCLRRIVAVLPANAEVVVVDGGHDDTGRIVKSLVTEFPAIRYIRNENDRGKGHAVHVGLQAARGEYLLQIDADLQFLPEEMELLLEPLLANRADLVLGSRFKSGATRRPGSTPAVRSFGNWVVSWYATLLFGQRMTDVLAGMKAWRHTVTKEIHLTTETCSYDAELPVKAVAAGFRVIDVAITTDARQGGVSAIHVVRDGRRILWDLTCFRLGWK
ncbi:MAG: glycosyltransferase family 2 protein [Planctomycetes bacterium]|nr:glycosyltransferase family 2 protein [Planctomycetota bacterium]